MSKNHKKNYCTASQNHGKNLHLRNYPLKNARKNVKKSQEKRLPAQPAMTMLRDVAVRANSDAYSSNRRCDFDRQRSYHQLRWRHTATTMMPLNPHISNGYRPRVEREEKST
ncbi:Hypothetical predicted protein [Olea europaea subsp. europaea]|uniref:Uncharacterized protein n=1 Tax=Olea europaea subsp. europaea TaxID=158383 RepID=A0A8S0RQQ6_OLEEU|nr:Hypothetical predicted protein [Olea europaea subsp. europaea]